MGFMEEHEAWIAKHLRLRAGERKSRLERGHGHGERLFLERVWWPLVGNFEDLHPEYEVLDWRGHPYFIDFAWLRGQCKFAFEIKGYGPHVQNTDRIRYRRELDRETFLQTLGYRVVSIPYDNLEDQPNLTIFLLKSLISPHISTHQREPGYSRLEREALLVAFRSNKAVRPIDLASSLRINQRTAVRCLKSLCAKGKLRPVLSGKGARVTRYELVSPRSEDWLW